MSAFLTLLLTYLLVWCDASSATRPLHFVHDHEDPELRRDTLRTAAHNEPFIFRRSRALAFPGSGPEPPAPVYPSAPVGRTLMNTRRIVFPQPGPPAAAVVGVRFPTGLHRDATPDKVTSSCVVSSNLTVLYNGTEWKLLSQRTCQKGEWAVMVAECQPGCRPRPCPKGKLQYQGRCVDVSDPTVCGEGQILYLTQTGSTFCDCEQDYFYHPSSSRCYARRERGPCDFGFFLDRDQSGNVDCMPNECQADGFEKDPTTGKCFRKDFTGYCPIADLEFHADNRTVGCMLLFTRNIFDRSITHSCTDGSRIDHVGKCREEIVVASATTMPRSLRQGCPTGFISSPGGSCRRVSGYI